MSSSPRRAVVEHHVRLDILCCLTGGPLALAQVSDRIGRDLARTKHHMQILAAFRIVKRKGRARGTQTAYVACMDEQPDWVRVAVEAHKSAVSR